MVFVAHGSPLFALQPGAAGAGLAELAQPRDEHLLPLFSALGAAGEGACARAIHRGIRDHVIAMDSCAFERAV